MPDIKELLAQLAAHPKTGPGLLRELSLEDVELRPVIAANPNCDLELLTNLSITHPKDTLSNPVFQLAEAHNGNGYSALSLRSLVSLCMACDPGVHAELLNETKSRIAEGIEELQGQDEASLSSAWLYTRAFTLKPKQCDNLIAEPIDFEIKVKALMQGSGRIVVSELPALGEETQINRVEMKKELEAFLSAISSGSIDNYFETDFSLEDSGDADLDIRAVNLPHELLLVNGTLYRVHPEDEERDEWEESLFEFEHVYRERSGPVKLRNEYYLVVPVVYRDEIEREYDISIGELSDLVGLKIHASETGVEIDWPSRLAELLLPT